MKFTLSTDTVCDIFRSELKERGIEYISTYYTIEGVEHKDEFTREEQFKEFYAKIRSGEMPTTSQVTKNDYDEFFDGLINKYADDVLTVTDLPRRRLPRDRSPRKYSSGRAGTFTLWTRWARQSRRGT